MEGKGASCLLTFGMGEERRGMGEFFHCWAWGARWECAAGGTTEWPTMRLCSDLGGRAFQRAGGGDSGGLVSSVFFFLFFFFGGGVGGKGVRGGWTRKARGFWERRGGGMGEFCSWAWGSAVGGLSGR